jgi:hypothetical protein
MVRVFLCVNCDTPVESRSLWGVKHVLCDKCAPDTSIKDAIAKREEEGKVIPTYACSKHRKYRPRKKPRAKGCETCQRMWAFRNSDIWRDPEARAKGVRKGAEG